MDSIHGSACGIIGLAITAIMIRLCWMSSPPFNTMDGAKLSKVKFWLVVIPAASMLLGIYLLTWPVDPKVIQRNQEEGFRYHEPQY